MTQTPCIVLLIILIYYSVWYGGHGANNLSSPQCPSVSGAVCTETRASILRLKRRQHSFSLCRSTLALDCCLASASTLPTTSYPTNPERQTTTSNVSHPSHSCKQTTYHTPRFLFKFACSLLHLLLKAVWRGLKWAIRPLVIKVSSSLCPIKATDLPFQQI